MANGYGYIHEEHVIFRKTLRKFLEKETYPYFGQWEKERQVPRKFWTKMGQNGFLCPWIEEKQGGYGVDFAYSVIFNEELKRVGQGLSSGICLHNDIVTPYFSAYENEEQKQRWLPKCISGEYISAIAMTEPGAGSDLAGVRTTAVMQDQLRL